MLPNLKRNTIAMVAALALASPATPALAWGEKEQNGLAALVAAGVIGTLIYNAQRNRAQASSRGYQPYYQGAAPQYSQQPTPQYQQPSTYVPNSYGQNSYSSSPYQGQTAAVSGIYDTPAARAFNGYSPAERRAIQMRMQSWGYYHGGIDGSFGPMTYRAVMAYAGDTSGTDGLSTIPGAYALYDSMIR
jgi:hypothetical protein